jgi:hypothetical protein
MSNILIEETIVKFGYNPLELKSTSEKLVICFCKICKTIREKKFRHSHQICLKCSNCINARTSKEKRTNTLKETWKRIGHPRLGIKHTEYSKQLMSEHSLGRKHTEETKLKLSIANKGEKNGFYGKHHKEESKRYGKDNNMFGKVPAHCKKVWYKDTCFRSTWESKTAEYFDKNNILWTYETDIIEINYSFEDKEKISTYRPDFFLINEGKYIEVKGHWRYGYKEKFDAALKVSKYPIELWDRIVLKEKGIL